MMKRRDFIACSSLMGGFMITQPFSTRLPAGTRLEMVKQALLSMQRASWEQGVAAQAFLESGDEDTAYLMAKEAVLRQTSEGRLSVLYTDNGVTDPAASGEAVLWAGRKYNDPELKKAADDMLRYLVEKAPKTSEGVLHHTLNSPEIWIDSMYMAPPFLAYAGKYQEAIKQVRGIRSYLWDPQEKLFSHRRHAVTREFINKSFWGVGNGWAMAGMCRIIEILPSTMKAEKKELTGYTLQAIEGCLRYIRPDYLFHNIIDQPDTFVETNLSQMLAYTIFTGIKGKWLDEKHLDIAQEMRKAAHEQVDGHGFVQGVCGAPYFNSAGRAAEGQAFFILMEAAFDKLNAKGQ